MKTVDYDTKSLVNSDKKIVLFGAGRILHVIENSKLSGIGAHIAYIIDNTADGFAYVFDRNIPICRPDVLYNEKNCIVIITSYVHMADMFDQLQTMRLSDTIECCVYPFIQIKEIHDLRQCLNDAARPRSIPKIIHSFWFSDDDKPDSYKRCIDSWYLLCPDYEIYEWNRDNYDCSKHPFLQKAIEYEAWAYASDYARLEIVNAYGGIYLDSDIELIRSPDSLLNYRGFFGFFDQGAIDLAAFGAESGNSLIHNLLEMYDIVKIPNTKEGFGKYFQPFFLMDEFIRFGVELSGEYQNINENIFLPREIMFPMDTILYEARAICDETIMIHHNNAGWKVSGYKEQKAKRSNRIYRLFTEES